MAQEERTTKSEPLELFSYDPIILLRDVLKQWYLIVMAAILVGMAAFAGTELGYQPVYTTNTTFVVTSRGDASTVFENLSATSDLAAVFSQVLNSSLLREKVLEEVGLDSFQGSIVTSAVEDTNLITMRVSDRDPRTAFLVTKAVVRHHGLVTKQVMGDTVLEVLQQPVVPDQPANPMQAGRNMLRFGLMAALGMFLLLGVLAFLRDTVRSRSEAEKKLEEQVLGEVCHEKKYHSLPALLRHDKTSILITDPATSFTFVEQVRKLRKKVERHMPPEGRTLLITSMLENEGKSTVAVNLALAMAQKQKKVLLIDADLHRPACHKILEQEQGSAGSVSEVVLGGRSLEKAVCPCTRLRALDLLLEWREKSDATDLINSEGMEKLLARAGEQYDFVVVDAPPMTAAADAECLAEVCHASILVIEEDCAKASLLNEGLDILHGAKSSMLGCVLNNMHTPVLAEMSRYGYGKSYGYGYGYGYGHYGKYGKYGKYGAYDGYRRESEPEEKAGMKDE